MHDLRGIAANTLAQKQRQCCFGVEIWSVSSAESETRQLVIFTSKKIGHVEYNDSAPAIRIDDAGCFYRERGINFGPG
jgi:hypothetical protein